MAHRDTIDSDFARFVANGDPAALGRVFDATCDDLYRLALHLTGAPSTAEDVVQSTWLAALEGASTYDPARPVQGWLTGILKNKAHTHHRREAVRRRPIQGEERWVDPVQEAERSELIEALDTGIAKLPEPYGPVVRLHLRHGLNANAIGEALDRPAGTVRTQLVRGLDKLRALLPQSLAGVAAALAIPTRGIPVVREAVLTKAAAGKAAAGAAGVLAVGGGVFRAFAAVLLLALGIFGAELLIGSDSEPAPAGVEEVGAVESDGDAGEPAEAAVAARVAEEPAEAAASSPVEVMIRGTVVDRDDAPVADAEVLVFAYGPVREGRSFEKPPIARSATGPDGSFQVSVRPGYFAVTARAEGQLAYEAFGGQTGRHETIEGLVVRLRPTVRSSGLVLDPEGRPVADQAVSFTRSYGYGEHVVTDYERIVREARGASNVTTDERGRFTVDSPEGASYWVGVSSRFAKFSESHEVTEGGEILVQLKAGDTASGRVFLADGRPAAGAEVRFHAFPQRRATADAEGRFEMQGIRRDDNSFISVRHQDAAVFCLQPVPEDASDLMLRLEDAQTIDGRVVDADGRGIEGALVRAVGERVIEPIAHHFREHTWEWANGRSETKTDKDGRFRFDSLYPGAFELKAALERFDVGAVSVTAWPGRGEAVIELSEDTMRGAAMQVQVLHRLTGEPVAAATVRVVPERGGQIRRLTTDATGSVEGAGFAPGKYDFTVEHGEMATAHESTALVLGDNPVRVEMSPAVDVELRVRTTDGRSVEDARVGVRLSNGESFMFPAGQSASSRIRLRDGRVLLKRVPTEVVTLSVARQGEDVVEQPLDLRVESGSVLEVVLDAPMPAVDFMVVVAGAKGDVEAPDLATDNGRQQMRALLQDERLFDPKLEVRAVVTAVRGGRELCRSTATPAGWDDVYKPEQYVMEKQRGWTPYIQKSDWAGGGSSGSAQPMPWPALELHGRAEPMTVRIEAEGFAPVTLQVDGRSVGPINRPKFVFLKRK